jgi:hypothetical protein
VLFDGTLESVGGLEQDTRGRVQRRGLDECVMGQRLRLDRGDRSVVVGHRPVGVRHAVPAVLPDLILQAERVGPQVAQESEVVCGEPSEDLADGRVQ